MYAIHSAITGGNGEEETPVPIPNTEVKLLSAESTWLDTAREDMSLPVFQKKALERVPFVFVFAFK